MKKIFLMIMLLVSLTTYSFRHREKVIKKPTYPNITVPYCKTPKGKEEAFERISKKYLSQGYVILRVIQDDKYINLNVYNKSENKSEWVREIYCDLGV